MGLRPPRVFDWPRRDGAQIRRDIDAELAHHLSLVEQECVRSGMGAEEAKLEARRRLGDLSSARREMIREDRRFEASHRLQSGLRALGEDVRFALRTFRDRPVFAGVTLATLAVGISTATVFFGAVHSILLQPLALEAPERVVSIWGTDDAIGAERDGLAPATVYDIGERSRSMESVAGAQPHSFDVEGRGGAISVNSWVVSENFFDVMRATPAAGRMLGLADFRGAGEPVVVITHSFWFRQFGGDPGAIGTSIALDGVPHRLVGVLPADFPQRSRDLIVPRPVDDGLWDSRFASFFTVYGRMFPGTSLETARADLNEVAGQLQLDYPDANEGRGLAVEHLRAELVGGVRRGLWLLFAAAVLILAVACINAAGLLLAQSTTRTRELAIRAAIGAGHGRLLRQLLTETSLLAGCAAALSVPLTFAGLGVFRRASPPGMPRVEELAPDLGIVLVATGIAFIVAMLVGLVPAVRVARPDLYEVLKPGGRSGTLTPATARLRSILVGSEVAIAVVLLVGGGLLLRSWGLTNEIDQGYSADNVAAVEAHFWDIYQTDTARAEFARLVTERLRAVPGVRAASVTTSLPLAEQIGNEDGQLSLPGDRMPLAVRFMVIGPDYFGAMEIPLLAGRPFSTADGDGSEALLILSVAAAERLWPGEESIGRQVLVGEDEETIEARVIGIARDVRYSGIEADPEPTAYVLHAQASTGSLYFVVRTTGGSGHAILQETLSDIQPALVLAGTVDLAENFSLARQPRRFSLMLLSAFGLIALSLTVVGLFGHLSHSIRTREHELGVRMALGAWPARLMRTVVGQGLHIVLLGALTGLALAFILSRSMSALLYGIAPFDPLTFTAAAAVVVAAGTAASYLPARRVAQVDPAVALRAE